MPAFAFNLFLYLSSSSIDNRSSLKEKSSLIKNDGFKSDQNGCEELYNSAL